LLSRRITVQDQSSSNPAPSSPNPKSANQGIAPGMQIGKYSLSRQLGEGEFGYVYQATRADVPDSTYTIKILKHPYRKDYPRLAKEIKANRQLSHRCLGKWLEIGIAGEKDAFAQLPYLVTEFMPGEAWPEFQKQTTVARDTLLRWAYEITETIKYLHDQEMIHGNLKPTNIHISWTNQRGQSIKLLDLGLGSLRKIRSADVKSWKYLSPEQFAGKGPSKASDIYVLGILLYELLTGIYPYESQSATDFVHWQQIHEHHPPRPLNDPVVPTAIAEIITKCLAKNPLKRPVAGEMVTALEKEIAGVGIPSYIGILGARGSGKTCYLTSIYSQVESTEETKNILEEKYIALYEKGFLPSATALSAYRLNFKITTEKKILRHHHQRLRW